MCLLRGDIQVGDYRIPEQTFFILQVKVLFTSLLKFNNQLHIILFSHKPFLLTLKQRYQYCEEGILY